jgi:hypothetical protein
MELMPLLTGTFALETAFASMCVPYHFMIGLKLLAAKKDLTLPGKKTASNA